MNQFCITDPNTCVDPANPVTNFTSEAPDAPVYIARAYGEQIDPPLNPLWTASSCRGQVRSTISQEDANLRAARINIECLEDRFPTEEPNPDGPDQPPFIPTGTTSYQNEEQTCTFTCPDGSSFTYTVPAGQFRAFSLVAANDQAHSYACNQAILLRICVGALNAEGKPEQCCVGTEYLKTVSFSSPTDQDYSAEIHDGTLPPGIQMEVVGADLILSGIPTDAGQYDVTIRVRAPGAVGYTDKAVSFVVLDIQPDALADGYFDSAYSETVVAVGPTTGTVVYSISDGALPPGLTLNPSTGVISGTPTVDGLWEFTVTITDEL